MPVEGGSYGGRGAEPGEMADVFDGLGGRLQELACAIDSGIGEPSHRRHSGLLTKPPRERPPRHVGAPGEGVKVMWKREVFEHPVAQWVELVATRLGPQLFDEPVMVERDAAPPAGRTPIVKCAATLALALWLLLSAACTGAAQPGTEPSVAPAGPSTTPPSNASARPTTPQPRRPRPQVALVTAELRNELVVVSLPGGRVVRRIPVARDPKTVSAAPGGPVAVVSPGSGTVTMFGASLRRLAVFRDFGSPQLATFTPDGEYLLVTDAAAGTLTSIELAGLRVVGRVAVGTGAHHLAVSTNDRRAWVALGESANTIVVVDVADPRHMRVLRRLHPAAEVHDIAFDPDGRTVWVSSASQPYVSVYGAASGRLVDTVPAGRAPQHVLFAVGHAYVTSGYGSSIEMVDPAGRTVVRRVELPYGSFNLASAGHWLVATSVLDGQVTVLRAATLRRRAGTTVASVARSVAVLSR